MRRPGGPDAVSADRRAGGDPARARALADHEFRERAARWDEREEYPWDNVKRLVEAGFLGMTIPGGLRRPGQALLDVVLAIEQIARVCGVTDASWSTRTWGRWAPSSTMAPRPRSRSTCRGCSRGTSRPSPSPSPAPAPRPPSRDARRAGRRCVGAQRNQALDHGRGRLADLRGAVPVRRYPGVGRDRRADRRRRHPRSAGHTARARDGDARHPRRGGRLRPLPDPRREPSPLLAGGFKQLMAAYNGQRLGAATVALGLAQGALEAAVQQGRRPRAVRPADRPLPGTPLDDRRHGAPGGDGAPAHLSRGGQRRRRAAST